MTTDYFPDRTAAGAALAKLLESYLGFDTLVLGVPRGGMEVAEALACRLGADLDVFVSRKIRTPGQPEVASGAVAEGGVILWNEDLMARFPLSERAWRHELERSTRELEERVRAYRAILPRAQVGGRHVIITDDGVATGATLKAAVTAVDRLAPKSMVLALPGGSRRALAELASLKGVDDVVAVTVPEPFYAVGQMYADFTQVSDSEVFDILHRTAERRVRHRAPPEARVH